MTFKGVYVMRAIWMGAILLAGWIAVWPVLADETAQMDATGLHGSLIVGGAFVSGRGDRLAYNKKQPRLQSLSDKADNETDLVPVVMGNLGYTFSSGTTLRTGIGLEEGYSLHLDQFLPNSGLLSLGVAYSRSDVWADPYLINVDRSRTDLTSWSLSANYSVQAGQGLYFSTAWKSRKVEDDAIGRRISELKRDGNIYEAGVGYVLPTQSLGVFQSGLTYTREALDGAANASHGYAISLGHSFDFGRLTFATGFSYGHIAHDRRHPLFDDKRKQSEYGVSETITCNNLFGNPRLFGLLMVSWQSTRSNYAFFDSHAMVSALGIGYAF
jgi:hypothetical protein